MTKKRIEKFIMSGDIQLMPRQATPIQITMWENWRDSINHYISTSEAYIEADRSADKLTATCRMEETKLQFNVFDVEGDFGTPHFVDCSIGFDELGRDTLVAYAICRHAVGVDFRKQDQIRRDLHEQLIESTINKLKENGLHFGDEERAKTGIRPLTSYWLDLLDANGKLDPRSISRTKRDSTATSPDITPNG